MHYCDRQGVREIMLTDLVSIVPVAGRVREALKSKKGKYTGSKQESVPNTFKPDKLSRATLLVKTRLVKSLRFLSVAED